MLRSLWQMCPSKEEVVGSDHVIETIIGIPICPVVSFLQRDRRYFTSAEI